MPNGSLLIYKGRRTRKKKASRVERTKCCRTDFGASLSVSCSITFLCRVSRRLALFRGTPECVRQYLRPAPFLCVCRSEQASAPVRRPVRCSLATNPCPSWVVAPGSFIYLLYTYIYILSVAISCVGVHSRNLCRRAVSLCVSDPA